MTSASIKGGAGFLLVDVDVEGQATPERLTEEQRMLRETVRKFVESELVPNLEELEKLNPKLTRELLTKAADLGLCMVDIPEEYGGLGLDYISSIQPSEIMNWGGGFQVTHSVHTTIGLLPILYFGSEELKQAYLPRFATAELCGAYALTEPGSGSDALAAKMTAVLSEDGESWVLNGSKQFITNGGWADVFTVFAQVDGKHFSAFVVERTDPGFEVGPEEHKLGIHSSSTTSLSLADCRIPKNRLIGEVGKGAKIALNVLNVGRLKLGVACVGAAKESIQVATKYALERRQFGRAIAEFGIIREKIAEMASRTYAAESTMMRTAGSINELIVSLQGEDPAARAAAMMTALREYNVECAIEKVHGSETQAFCADEAIQIHGGYGFIEEYSVARNYRDARITRLYEGTNEINRMQIAGDILKRVAKGDFSFEHSDADSSADGWGELAAVASQTRKAKAVVAGIVDLIRHTAGAKVDKTGEDQELLQRLADIVIAIYVIESCMARARQARDGSHQFADVFEAMTRVYAADLAGSIERGAREAVMLLADEGAETSAIEKVLTLAAAEPVNVIGLRRSVADAVIGREGEWFE